MWVIHPRSYFGPGSRFCLGVRLSFCLHRRSVRPNRSSFESAEAQSSLKQLADVVRESDLRAFAGPTSGVRRVRIVIPAALSVTVILVTRSRQECDEFACTFLYGKAHDLPARIDVCCQVQMQGGGSR